MILVKLVVTVNCVLWSKCVWLWSRMKSISVHVRSKLTYKLLCEQHFDIDYRENALLIDCSNFSALNDLDKICKSTC